MGWTHIMPFSAQMRITFYVLARSLSLGWFTAYKRATAHWMVRVRAAHIHEKHSTLSANAVPGVIITFMAVVYVIFHFVVRAFYGPALVCVMCRIMCAFLSLSFSLWTTVHRRCAVKTHQRAAVTTKPTQKRVNESNNIKNNGCSKRSRSLRESTIICRKRIKNP